MSSNVNSFGKPDKKRMQVNQQIFHNLLEIVELYPQYSVVKHLVTILRRKSSKGKIPYEWTNEELLKRIEQHKEELEGDQLMLITDDENTDIGID